MITIDRQKPFCCLPQLKIQFIRPLRIKSIFTRLSQIIHASRRAKVLANDHACQLRARKFYQYAFVAI